MWYNTPCQPLLGFCCGCFCTFHRGRVRGQINYSRIREGPALPLARRLVNGRERGCLQVVPCIVLRLVNMSTRAMRLKTQARVLACLQVVYPNLSLVKEQSLSASLVRLEKELFPLYLATCFASGLRPADISRAPFALGVKITPGPQTCSRAPVGLRPRRSWRTHFPRMKIS